MISSNSYFIFYFVIVLVFLAFYYCIVTIAYEQNLELITLRKILD